MRIVIHAGLHKSGTTTVQFHWKDAFANGESVRYPVENGMTLPGHHTAAWPLLDAFRNETTPDMVWAKRVDRSLHDLAGIVSRASDDGVETLLISSEEFDRITAVDGERLSRIFDGHETIGLVTLTRPVHRWCSGWQELVKQGLAAYPGEATEQIATFSSLRPGRVQEIAEALPTDRKIFRVVRTSPPEQDLARELAGSLGIEWPASAPLSTARNRSLGRDVEILAKLNSAGMTCGIHNGGRRVLQRCLESGEITGGPRLDRTQFAIPEYILQAARQEASFLQIPPAGVEVQDPHDELTEWTLLNPVNWYSELSETEQFLPAHYSGSEASTSSSWRSRLRTAAAETNARQLRSALDKSSQEIEKLQQEVSTLKQELRASEDISTEIRQSASWRATAPLRTARRYLQNRNSSD